MAQDGWLIKDMKFGILYTFEKAEPVNMVYEADRFNLPDHPSEKDIRQKEEFCAIAGELGWHEVMHDEDMNYYFAKEYDENGINELYDSEESKRLHAEKYSSHYVDLVINLLNKAGIIFAALTFIFLLMWSEGFANEFYNIFITVFAILGVAIIYMTALIQKLGRLYYNEFIMSREEWEQQYERKSHEKKVHRLFLRAKPLTGYLARMSRQGWHIKDFFTYTQVFEAGQTAEYRYAIDTMYMTNKRSRHEGGRAYNDKKDLIGQNNDWQVKSLKDAKNKGWIYVCAMDNRAVLYRSEAFADCEPLNPPEYERKWLTGALLGAAGRIMLMGAAVGFILGIVMSMFG